MLTTTRKRGREEEEEEEEKDMEKDALEKHREHQLQRMMIQLYPGIGREAISSTTRRRSEEEEEEGAARGRKR